MGEKEPICSSTLLIHVLKVSEIYLNPELQDLKMKGPEAHEDSTMVIEQIKESLLYLEEILFDGDEAENSPRAKLAWLIDITSVLEELMDLGKNNSAIRDLIFTRDFAFQILDGFPFKLRRKLRKCEGEGQLLFENLVNKIEEIRGNAQEEVNELDIALYDDDVVAKVDEDSKDNSGTEGMGKASLNVAGKVDVFELSEQQIEMNLKDKVSLDDSNAYTAVEGNENEQLDDLKATTADVNFFDNEIEHNPGEESNVHKKWGMEEQVETFKGMNGGLDDKIDVDGEVDHNYEEENPDKNSKADAEDLSYPSFSICLSTDVNSVASVKKPGMLSDDVVLLSEETFKENSDGIIEIHEKYPDDKVTNKEVTQLEVHDFNPENHVGSLEKIRDKIGEGKKRENKAINDELIDCNGLKLAQIAKKLEDKVGLDNANAHKARDNNENDLLNDSKATIAEESAYEDSRATMFVPRTDLNANFVKEEVEHHSDGTSDNINGRFNYISDVVKLEIEDKNDFECQAIHSNFERTFVVDGPNLDGDEKKEVVHDVTDNGEEKVSTEELIVMKTVRIFKNKKYLQSKVYRIQGNDMMSFGVKEILSENQMNDDHNTTEDDGDEYLDVQVEILDAPDRELLEKVARDPKEELRDDDEITAKLDEDILDTNEGNRLVDAKEYSEESLEKLTETENNAVNLRCEDVHIKDTLVHISRPALKVGKLDTKNILDDIVKAKNQDAEAITVNDEVDGGNKKSASNGAPSFNSFKEPDADTVDDLSDKNFKDMKEETENSPVDKLMSVAILMYHDVARLDIFKSFPRFHWRPGDPSYPSYSALKNIFTQLMFLHRVMYTEDSGVNTADSQVFDEYSVFMDMSCTSVDKQEEPDVKNTKISEYEEFTTKFREKVNKGAMMTKLRTTKGCDNCCCYPHCMMNEHGKTAGTLDVDVELCKESLFPGLLDRAWDEFEDHKVEVFDDLPMVQVKLVSVLHTTLTDLDQDGSNAEEDQFLFSASANISDTMSSILQGLLAGKDNSLSLAGASYQVRVSRIVYSTYIFHPRTRITAVW